MTAQSTPAAVFDPVRLARLSRGLLMTLRSLNGRSGDWNDVSTSRTLAIQRFFREFDAWIGEPEKTNAAETEAQPDGSRNWTRDELYGD